MKSTGFTAWEVSGKIINAVDQAHCITYLFLWEASSSTINEVDQVLFVAGLPCMGCNWVTKTSLRRFFVYLCAHIRLFGL